MVPSQLTFRRHACDRLAERLSLTAEEVIEIIDNDLCVLIGEEDNRYHKVFYSRPDKQCFVAIHDHETNELVTILPLDYHHRWQISEAVYFEAKAKICPYELTRPVQLEPVSEIPAVVCPSAPLVTPQQVTANGAKEPSVNLRFICYFRGRIDGRAHTASFGSKFLLANVKEQLERIDLKQLIKNNVSADIWNDCELQSVYYRIGKDRTLHEFNISVPVEIPSE